MKNDFDGSFVLGHAKEQTPELKKFMSMETPKIEMPREKKKEKTRKVLT